MRKYYYIDSNRNGQGPVEAYKLPSLGVTPNTYVWTKGMLNWDHAYNIPELREILSSSTPVQEQTTSSVVTSEVPYGSSNIQDMATVNIEPSKTFLEIIKPLLLGIGCFALTALIIWLIILLFEMLNDGNSHYVRVRVAIFILPLLLFWRGIKYIGQFLKQFF